MADVGNLVRKVDQLVEKDTVDGVSSLRLGRQFELSKGHEEMLEPLAANLDLPGRLAPVIHAIGDRRDGQWYDPRADARAGLTELVALCAGSLEPDPTLPPPADPEARDRLTRAVNRAYAANATPRLVADLFPNGRSDDLGQFTPPQLEGDVAAARAMAIAIGARTGMREADVLRKLVADGPGGAAYAATDLLLRNRPDYQRLPGEQQPGIRRHLARSIEAGFAARDVRQAAERELTEELEARREDVSGGAGTIDVASAMATDELGKLHTFLQDIDYWQRSAEPYAEPQLDEVRGIVAERLVSRVEHHAGTATDLTFDQLRVPAAATDAAAATMVTASTIPHESRPAARAATATMLTEGFDELPARMAEWRADGWDMRQHAELYGGALGDRTLAAVRTFERRPPSPRAAAAPDRAQNAAASFATDPAMPPLRRIHAGESRRADESSVRPRNGGTDGLTR
ncbi:hypothetical protein [Kribbella shirazensis]|uniref:Uncharacterized protein n=1 Tax=Kribbella shirazensis TaxID=1105143 RepID=A0A7X5VJF2_9ACTN|nr:hypothetical protein [Kribbella shirazensis]NIK62189.1 hypothetical protein [Kribbella shirazensis]